MKLYCITDAEDPGSQDSCEQAWWTAVWSESALHALAYALVNYGGECWIDDDPGLKVASSFDPSKFLVAPEMPDDVIEAVEERSMEVLRHAGWREEGESECDCCGLFASGLEDHTVCLECFMCVECGCECMEDEDE